MKKTILVLAGDHTQWRIWAREFIASHPDSKMRFFNQEIHTDSLIYKSVTSIDRARGLGFSEIVTTGTWYRTFSGEDINYLRRRAEIFA